MAQYSADLETINAELSAVLDYYAKIKERCIAKPKVTQNGKGGARPRLMV